MITRGKVIRSGSREALKDIAQQNTFILTAEDTDGRFEWVESVVDFGGGPPNSYSLRGGGSVYRSGRARSSSRSITS